MYQRELLKKGIVFDTETGGLDPEKSALCSVTFKTYGKDDIFTIWIKPIEGLEYNSIALDVNKITIDKLEKEGISEKEAISMIIEFLSNSGYHPTHKPWNNPTVIGHNVKFDIAFMDALFKRNGMGSFSNMINYHNRDTMAVQLFLRDCGFNIRNVNLTDTYYDLFGTNFKDAHTSEADVLATEQVYMKQIEMIKELKNNNRGTKC